MNILNKKIASAIAAGAMLANLAAPLLASTTIQITGNGVDTKNEAEVEFKQETNIQQQNVADIQNDVDVDATTGDNDASRNTGGDVAIDTGAAKVAVGVVNSANSNVADVNACCPTDVDVLIEGNGDDSKNEVELEHESETNLSQWNTADVENDVDVDAATGRNSARSNTGGEVSIFTGKADVETTLLNTLNSNSARIGRGDGGDAGSVSLRILGNGVDSDNEIELELESEKNLEQGNIADVQNDVDVDAKTGWNRASRNTGGEVWIDTGAANVDVLVDTLANFNWAEVEDCLCPLDLLVKVAENGDDSDNEIKAELESELWAGQFNEFECDGRDYDLYSLFGGYGKKGSCNDVDVDAATGKNDAKSNTGESGADPSVFTGDAEADVLVETTTNSNVLGTGPGDHHPEWPDFEFDMGFDWMALWLLFSGMSS
jgi:hypothetical protein